MRNVWPLPEPGRERAQPSSTQRCHCEMSPSEQKERRAAQEDDRGRSPPRSERGGQGLAQRVPGQARPQRVQAAVCARRPCGRGGPRAARASCLVLRTAGPISAPRNAGFSGAPETPPRSRLCPVPPAQRGRCVGGAAWPLCVPAVGAVTSHTHGRKTWRFQLVCNTTKFHNVHMQCGHGPCTKTSNHDLAPRRVLWGDRVRICGPSAVSPAPGSSRE